jgi:hypothetical protein
MLQGYIVDPETGKVVAAIRHGEVFRDDKEGAKIATVLNANLYDLSGNLVGRLDGPHAIDVRTWSMPIAVRNLLEGETAHHPVPAVKQKGGPIVAPSRSARRSTQLTAAARAIVQIAHLVRKIDFCDREIARLNATSALRHAHITPVLMGSAPVFSTLFQLRRAYFLLSQG